MALRDTLKSVTDRAREDAEFETRKPQFIADWQASVQKLNAQIREWLAEYEMEGSISFETEQSEVREEMLGVYQVEAMNIRLGPFLVRVQPAGRIIIGAVGRVDMYRQGRSSSDERVLFLRQKDAEGESWKLRKPPAGGGSNFNLQPLDRDSFEAALDELFN